MKKIKLTQNKIAIVDNFDYEELSRYKWCAHRDGNNYYVIRGIYNSITKRTNIIYMHNQIIGFKGIDHINGNGLDNRRCNLRTATRSQNAANCRKHNRNASSKFKGVRWCNWVNQWMVRISKNYKSIFIGYFKSEKEAAKAYNEKAKEFFGKYARLNNL